jgi:hypothetical protein
MQMSSSLPASAPFSVPEIILIIFLLINGYGGIRGAAWSRVLSPTARAFFAILGIALISLAVLMITKVIRL